MSAKTLPLPVSIFSLPARDLLVFVPLVLAFTGHAFQIAAACNRLLLKCVKHVDNFREFDRVDCAIRIAVMMVYDLKNARAAKACQWLRGRRFSSYLGLVQRKADYILTAAGNDLRALRDEPIHTTVLIG